MTPERSRRVLSAACAAGLVALGLMVWSLFDPRPLPVITAMSVGQVLGTLSLGSFLYVALTDLRARLRAARDLRGEGDEPDEPGRPTRKLE